MKKLIKLSFSRNYKKELKFDFIFEYNQFNKSGVVTGSIYFKNLKIGHNEKWEYHFQNSLLTKKQEENIKNQIQKYLYKDYDYKLQVDRALLINRNMKNNSFWVLNKKTNEPFICGSIVAVNEITEINKDSLYEKFSRKKLTEFENEKWRIYKTNVIRSLRNAR